ncbi:MAG: hypothetical protein HC831_14045, partial [Chloroflexia bacterium]|nr:hypothetical protein [Chloroflexia bacterium]
MVNPDDVASMTVLKSTAASTLYGSRGANGAIIITTKSGSKRKGVGVTFSAGYEMSDILRLPEFQ